MNHLYGKLRRLLRFLRNSNGSPAGILAPGAFGEALERERSRADRTGLPLSVVVLEKSRKLRAGMNGQPDPLTAAGRALATQLRCTDVIGWLGEARLGLILSNTPAEAAWRVVERARSQMREKAGRAAAEMVTCEVFAYPLETDGEGSTEDSPLRHTDTLMGGRFGAGRCCGKEGEGG